MTELSQVSKTERLAWWQSASFGLFIHWGLYAIPAGTWKGKKIGSIGEWIMRHGKIPISDYEELAADFNPTAFDAEAWVALAKRAGAKYLVITAKHHDGFCLFDSPSNPYNIVKQSPFGRDPMKELADACEKAGLVFCFYYSQAQDWHAPGGAGHWEEAGDAPDERGYTRPLEDFETYLEDVVKPNIRELLTQYGPIGLIWFDTPVIINKQQSESLRDFVHELQPDCLVSGRVGHGVGDYGSLGDNQHPAGKIDGAWETPCTLNDTWGFKSYDQNWKSIDYLIELLVNCASKGVNYLLNIGPTAEGIVPQPSVELLDQLGEWLDRNGEAIYGTSASPFPTDPAWGRMTYKDGAIYLLFKRWPGEAFKLYGLKNRVTGVRVLGQPDATVEFQQDGDQVALSLPAEAPEAVVSVVALTIEGTPDVEQMPIQQDGNTINLPAHIATIKGDVTVGCDGAIEGWRDTSVSVDWTFRVHTPGTFHVKAVTNACKHRISQFGNHALKAVIAGQTVQGTAGIKDIDESPEAAPWQFLSKSIGTVDLTEPGEYQLHACADRVDTAAERGLTLAAIELVPVQSL
jgi:alpha-L-fucosidase